MNKRYREVIMIGKYKIDMARGKNGATVYKICDTEKGEMLPDEYEFMSGAILAAVVLEG